MARRLAAIMFTDIVGYTAMMQTNEQEGIHTVGRYRNILQRRLAQFGGEVLQHMGDGSLCLFSSSVNAVKCAEQIQRDIQQVQSLFVRIGIHLGDIVENNGDYFGDGINIASRLESLGEPGSVLFTERVAQDIMNHPGLKVTLVGTYDFKNVSQPHKVYALATKGITIPLAKKEAGKAKVHLNQKKANLLFWALPILVFIILVLVIKISRQEKESQISSETIAILPFLNKTQNQEYDYLCEGIPENLMHKLSALPNMKVISKASISAIKTMVERPSEAGRKLQATKVLSGWLQLKDEKFQVQVTLTDSKEKTQLWTHIFNSSLSEIYNLEQEIEELLIKELDRESFTKASNFSEIRSKTTNAKAYQLYLQGKFLIQKSTPKDINHGLDLLRKSITEDPQFARTYAAIADAMYLQAFFSAAKRSEIVGEGITAGNSAIALDPNLAETHTALAEMKFYFEFNHEGAEISFQKALEINPNESTTCIRYSNFLLARCRFDEALEYARRALETDPISISALHGIGIVYYFKGDYTSAARSFDEALKIHPNWTWGHIKGGLSHALTGNCERAMELSKKAEEGLKGWGSARMQAWLARNYHLCGEMTLYQRAYDRVMQGVKEDRIEDPFALAELYSVTENVEEILKWFYVAYEQKSPSLTFLPIYRCLDFIPDSFKENERYLNLMEKVFGGIPE